MNHKTKNSKPCGTVGIMTFHWAANYGAVLQAWALQHFLQQNNFRTEMIDYVPANLRISLPRCFKARHVNTMKLRIKEYKKERLIKEFRQKKLSISAVRYSTNEELKQYPPEYDYYISGSDQIWNPYFTMKGQKGVTLSYYLDFVPDNRHRIAFSSSFGCRKLAEEVVKTIKPELEKFYAISTREAEGVEILRDMGLSGVNTADPTILLSAKDYEGLISQQGKVKKVIYAYILHGQKKIAEALITQVAQQLSYPVCDDDVLTVEDWLEHIRTASFVITNSFHCVVFCLLFHVPFYAIDVKGVDMGSRITTLLGEVGLANRFLGLPVDISQIPWNNLQDICWDDIDERLETIREYAQSYLLGVLTKRNRIDDVPASRCTGCGLCTMVCPKKCIGMQEDKNGFLYPSIDECACVHCGLCLKNCIVFSKVSGKRSRPDSYACWNLDETIRIGSSSGGAFTALGNTVLMSGGVVYGAKYVDDLNVEHSSAKALTELKGLRGSKYQPSSAWKAFEKIRSDLANGKKVLFAGTPCQAMALRQYLGKSNNLIYIDVACHGVPSLKIIRDKCRKISRENLVRKIDFRNKISGWKDYHCVYYDAHGNILHSELASESEFMLGYIENLYIRESCEDCQFASIPRVGDISLADCWMKAHDGTDTTDKGITAVLINTETGKKLFESAKPMLHIENMDIGDILKGTPTLAKGCSHSGKRSEFWYQYNCGGYEKVMARFFRRSIVKRKILRMVKSKIRVKHE